MPTSERATLAEIYSTLNQLVEAYVNVIQTFSTVVTEVGEIRAEVKQLNEFISEHFADAVTGRNVWRANAEHHRKEAEQLRAQLNALLGEGERPS